MKKVFLCVLVSASLIACTSSEKKTAETTEQASAKVEHIYKPTYTDNFKIGGESNVLLAEQFHKAIFANDLKTAAEMISDTARFDNEDGTSMKGKEAIVAYMEKAFAGLTFKNYNIAAILPVVGENGHQWVDIWDEAELVTPDGKSMKMRWSDAFQFENGKIVHFVGFGKEVK